MTSRPAVGDDTPNANPFSPVLCHFTARMRKTLFAPTNLQAGLRLKMSAISNVCYSAVT